MSSANFLPSESVSALVNRGYKRRTVNFFRKSVEIFGIGNPLLDLPVLLQCGKIESVNKQFSHIEVDS